MRSRRLGPEIAFQALAYLGVVRNRIATSKVEGSSSNISDWRGAEPGAIGVYDVDGEHFIVARNSKELPHPRTTLIFPAELYEKVTEAIREGRIRYKKELE